MNLTIQHLSEALYHPDKNVRGAAAVSLGKLGTPGVVTLLLDALVGEQELYVREDITWALVRMSAEALPGLTALTNDSNPATRHHAVHVLGKIGGAQVAEALIGVLTDSDPAVICKAAFGLGQVGDERAIAALVSLVGHPNHEVQTMVMQVLERFGRAAVEPLMARMADEQWPVREQAADILGGIGEQAAVPVLITALTDPVWQVRFAAVTALSHMGGRAAKAALMQMGDDPEPRVRDMAARVNKRGRL